ncbi:hypothetical protein IMG5_144950 [Ichthyophthirius multifiliis]|uniref:Uncharacterized protein n=1 Tax=Ichthyophthirius multifiliis TaxID=5932 RepID=G0QXS5_ICHMU|nr:hypothetical protein IMG5_144950 [Ichthyophthirius multifiliis]EGR29976.1 hypothetical protein IMG5_144950 [Ichthyophthirius multifiliis]|eukprot:XP_004031212.1 hypothetical protein IMG5_144950 [Ichthyophthirius multifiliis]
MQKTNKKISIKKQNKRNVQTPNVNKNILTIQNQENKQKIYINLIKSIYVNYMNKAKHVMKKNNFVYLHMEKKIYGYIYFFKKKLIQKIKIQNFQNNEDNNFQKQNEFQRKPKEEFQRKPKEDKLEKKEKKEIKQQKFELQYKNSNRTNQNINNNIQQRSYEQEEIDFDKKEQQLMQEINQNEDQVFSNCSEWESDTQENESFSLNKEEQNKIQNLKKRIIGIIFIKIMNF